MNFRRQSFNNRSISSLHVTQFSEPLGVMDGASAPISNANYSRSLPIYPLYYNVLTSKQSHSAYSHVANILGHIQNPAKYFNKCRTKLTFPLQNTKCIVMYLFYCAHCRFLLPRLLRVHIVSFMFQQNRAEKINIFW
jgi:hypothetical protein